MRPKAGHEQALIELNQEWQRVRKPSVKGAVGAYILRPDNKKDEMLLFAIFEDRQTYRANADDPEQDRWFRRVREHLESDPLWEDGEITATG
jgi:quinol monooxygenase YgiN